MEKRLNLLDEWLTASRIWMSAAELHMRLVRDERVNQRAIEIAANYSRELQLAAEKARDAYTRSAT